MYNIFEYIKKATNKLAAGTVCGNYSPTLCTKNMKQIKRKSNNYE